MSMRKKHIGWTGLLLVPVFAPVARAQSPAAAGSDVQDVVQRLRDVEQELRELRALSEQSAPGLHRFVISGFGSTTFADAEGSSSSFRAAFNPIFLYEMGEFVFLSCLKFTMIFSEFRWNEIKPEFLEDFRFIFTRNEFVASEEAVFIELESLFLSASPHLGAVLFGARKIKKRRRKFFVRDDTQVTINPRV